MGESLAGDADWLAGEAAADEVDIRETAITASRKFPVFSVDPQWPRKVVLDSCSGDRPGNASRQFGVGHITGSGSVNASHIPKSRDIWPVLGEDALTEGIIFDLPEDFPSGSFKAKIKTTYSREQ